MTSATITKRLHISGLTPAITSNDIQERFSVFGTVTALDGFGLLDGVGQPRKFGYVTLEATAPQLTKCLNVLSGSVWKGAKLRIGEAKPDFRARLMTEWNTVREPPQKRRRRGVATHAAIAASGIQSLEALPPTIPTLPNSANLYPLSSPDLRSPRKEAVLETQTTNKPPSTRLKDLFAPHEEEAGFSLLGQLALDLEMDEELSFSPLVRVSEPIPLAARSAADFPQTASESSNVGRLSLDPRLPLFFPLFTSSCTRQVTKMCKDVFGLVQENGWDWRDPAVGFCRTETEDDIRRRWESCKVDLTKDWKRRWKEVSKARKRRGNSGGGNE